MAKPKIKIEPIVTNVSYTIAEIPWDRSVMITVEGMAHGKHVSQGGKFTADQVDILGGLRAARETVLDKLIVRILNGED